MKAIIFAILLISSLESFKPFSKLPVDLSEMKKVFYKIKERNLQNSKYVFIIDKGKFVLK